MPDLDAPTAPDAMITRFIDDGSNTWDGLPVDFVHVEFEGVEARVELEITEANGTTHRLHRAQSCGFGMGGCINCSGYAMSTATLSVRARNIDWAGHTSDWVDVPVSGDIPESDPVGVGPASGCSTRPAPAPLVAWSLVALVLARRRASNVD